MKTNSDLLREVEDNFDKAYRSINRIGGQQFEIAKRANSLIRRIEQRKGDPEIDEALSRLSSECVFPCWSSAAGSPTLASFASMYRYYPNKDEWIRAGGIIPLSELHNKAINRRLMKQAQASDEDDDGAFLGDDAS